MMDTSPDYAEMLNKIGEDQFKNRFEELKNSATEFLEIAGYKDTVMCNERILLSVLLDYYSDIYRLKDFHNIELIREEKIFAYTVAWIVRRKPLQFTHNTDLEKDIYVNERFAAYLIVNECLCCGGKRISPENINKLDDYTDLLLYYFKYRECNPQVLELAIESFKLGTLVLK